MILDQSGTSTEKYLTLLTEGLKVQLNLDSLPRIPQLTEMSAMGTDFISSYNKSLACWNAESWRGFQTRTGCVQCGYRYPWGGFFGPALRKHSKFILFITCWFLLIGLLYINLIGDLFLFRCCKEENLNHRLLITGYSRGSDATRSNGVSVCKWSSCTNRHAHLRHVFPSDKLNFSHLLRIARWGLV